MGRHHRDLTRSEWFHVYNRGTDRQDIFSADGDWTLFEQLTAEAFERFAIELHAYALMTNHFHFLGRAGDGGLSEAMQRLCGRYGAAYNERTGRTGSLFTGRFQSVPITSDAQLTQTARYIHRNPLAIVPAAALDTYRWSSLGALLGRRRAPDWLATGTVLESDSDREGYLRYVLEPQPSDREAYGSLEPLTPTTCDQIDAAVDVVMSRSCVPSAPGVRRADVARMLAVTIAVRTRAAENTQLAGRYGLADPGSVRRLARRGRVRAAEPGWFQQLHHSVMRCLTST